MTTSPNDSDIPATRYSLWALVPLRGLAQIGFADHAGVGLLIFAGAALLAPFGAAGALLGTVAGTLAGRLGRSCEESEWTVGLAGYNPAILGLLWGGVLARLDSWSLLFGPALLVCVVLDPLVRRVMRALDLPPLALTAVLLGWASDLLFRAVGESFWLHPPLLPFGDLGVGGGILLIALGLIRVSPAVGLLTAVLTGAAALVSGWAWGLHGIGPVGLWGFTVAPAAYGCYAILRGYGRSGALAATLAAGLGALIWIAWIESGFVVVLPPLVMPAIVAIWVVLSICHRLGGLPVLHPGVWRAVTLLRRARARGQRVVALTGAGMSTASGIPDYTTDAWLEPGVAPSEYGFERYLHSASARQAYWASCRRFRDMAASAQANPAHIAIASLQKRGWVSEIITQNVDRLHQRAGATGVIELHGRIDGARCLGCGWTGPWPKGRPWESGDARCVACGGLIKPAVVAMGEDVPAWTWHEAERAAGDCNVLLVLGARLAVTTAAALVARARRNGAQIVFVNLGPLAQPILEEDLRLELPLETALPAIAYLLDGKGTRTGRT